MLLSGAALLGRSLYAVTRVDPGFSLGEGLIVSFTVPGDGTPESLARQVAFQDTVVGRLRTQPGVAAVGLINAFPLPLNADGFFPNGTFIEMTRPDEITSFTGFNRHAPEIRVRSGEARYRKVSADYFAAMQIPLRRGRLIDDRDAPTGPHVGVISQSLADAQWPGRDALGRWIQFGNMDGDLRAIEIVGIVGDVREVDADVPATTTTVSAALDVIRSSRRFTLWLVGAFGITALVLASLGVYGLFAYTVSKRTREMGIRMALGAEPRTLVWLIVRRGLLLAATGAAIGVGLSRVGAGTLDGLLYSVTPGDPLIIGAAVVIMIVISGLASYAPARRILRQTPGKTLRDI